MFLTDGDVPIDNNASERAIRGFCIGKKNWQVIDTINGAARELEVNYPETPNNSILSVHVNIFSLN